MIPTLSRSVRDNIVRLGFAEAAFWLYGRVARANPRSILVNARIRRDGAPDGLPIPPPELIFLVAGTTDIAWFLHAGELGAATVRDALMKQGVDVTQVRQVLDFGCGCGRVLRHWHAFPNMRVRGCDYNAALIEWCRSHLPFGEYAVNNLEPPLGYANGQFDVVYAFSVFTHLTEDLQMRWTKELTRVVRQGGHLMISTHGTSYVDRLSAEERARFDAGELVVKNNIKSPGSNTCSAYHPPEYFRTHLVHGLEMVDFAPHGARGNPSQDLYVFRRV